MFTKIDATTSPQSLIALGAAEDGKITQQVELAQRGIPIPRTFFFTSEIIIQTSEGFSVNESFLKRVIRTGRGGEYQIRTETANEMNRSADEFSESRLGLLEDNLAENLLSVCVKKNTIQPLVGLVQELPPESLDRNTLAGLAQLVIKQGKQNLYITAHRGLATYVARVGTCDIIIEQSVNDDTPSITYMDDGTLLSNLQLNIMRYGIRLATKKASLLGIEPLTLPWHEKKDRYKKEYEYSKEELATIHSLDDTLLEKISGLTNDPVYQQLLTRLELTLENRLTLRQLLTALGAYYLYQFADEHNTTKQYISSFVQGNIVVTSAQVDFLTANLLKLSDILSDHLVSFSVVIDETRDFSEQLIIWDLPLGKELTIASSQEEVLWITSFEDLASLKEHERVGIALPVSDIVAEDLLRILQQLKKHSTIKEIHTPYSLLSHPATLIREQGYTVVHGLPPVQE